MGSCSSKKLVLTVDQIKDVLEEIDDGLNVASKTLNFLVTNASMFDKSDRRQIAELQDKIVKPPPLERH
jgi:hypothetical protein